MKMKSLFIICVVGFASISILADSAWAGNVQRNRWEGVAIGIGAAILGKVIWDNVHRGRPEHAYAHPSPPYAHRKHHYAYPKRHYNYPQYPSYIYPQYTPQRRSYTPYRSEPRGHWEIRKVWVPPVFRNVWNPSHYDGRGRRVPGRWIRVEQRPGYWKKERVWIAENNYRPYVD